MEIYKTSMNKKELELLSFFLPEGTLEWFDVVGGTKTKTQITVILEEKNIPPITEEIKGKKIKSKGFKNISVNDFPIRGRKVTLIFRRRYWQVEGESELLKRDILLCASGTQLEKEFADFLKE